MDELIKYLDVLKYFTPFIIFFLGIALHNQRQQKIDTKNRFASLEAKIEALGKDMSEKASLTEVKEILEKESRTTRDDVADKVTVLINGIQGLEKRFNDLMMHMIDTKSKGP